MHEHNGIPRPERGPERVVANGEGIITAGPAERIANPRSWLLVSALIGAILLAIVVLGVLAFNENQRVADVTRQALTFDVEVEDEGDDVRIAVLDLRHLHRNLIFSGASATAIADFDDAYAALLEELQELERLELDDQGLPHQERIHSLAERYYADFRPAIDNAADDPQAFLAASDIGLARLASMDAAASELDEYGEILADDALIRVSDATRTEQLMLTGLVIGAVLVGIALALLAGRILARLRTLYEREQQSRRELARSLQTKTDFVADASHELRTPLAVILGNAETALARDDHQLHATSLAAIAEEANRMGKLVDDLLFLARSDAGAPPLDKEYVPARWLVSRLTKPGEMLAQQQSSCLTTGIEGEGYLDADPGRIEQAALILIDNAARHSPPGSCARLASWIERSYLAIEVSDKGSGISPEELPLIFDRFYQVKNRRARKWGASGLGLSIARTIVAAHGGSITAESRLGEGTRMTIRLPLSPLPDTSGAGSRESEVVMRMP